MLHAISCPQLFDSVGDGNLGFQVHNVREDENGNGLMFARVCSQQSYDVSYMYVVITALDY